MAGRDIETQHARRDAARDDRIKGLGHGLGFTDERAAHMPFSALVSHNSRRGRGEVRSPLGGAENTSDPVVLVPPYEHFIPPAAPTS
jgi:hypothetical protein